MRVMALPRLSLADLAEGHGGLELSSTGEPVLPAVVVELDRDAPEEVLASAARAAARNGRAVIGLLDAPPAPRHAALLEALAFTLAPAGTPCTPQLVLHPEPEQALADLGAATEQAPRAAATLVRLLRLTSVLPVPDGLVAESLAYSTLLAGPEFAAWRGEPRGAAPIERGTPVLIDRDDAVLRLTLNSPDRHNAYSRLMRDALVEGLELALADPSLRRVELRGAGPSFCSGGELDEFGTTPDVSSAHLVRVERSAAALLHACSDRVVAQVHGACIGAGVELAAFAAHVQAHPSSWFQLPELRLGLVPGAGGTVSVTRRIGRWRTAYLVLTGCRLDAATALEWGLVDELG